eukprot:scaffold5905_cov137-Skeletonema_menzelii.AAC.4
MRKGFLLTSDKKEKRQAQSSNEADIDSDPPSVLRDRRNDKRHDETTPRGLSMKQGFLLQSSPTATRRKNNQEERTSSSGRKGKATHLPKSTVNKKSVVTTKSAALLDLEADSDGAVSSPSLFNFIATSEESTCSRNDRRDDEASDCKNTPIMVEIDDRPISIIAEKTMNDVGSVDATTNDNDLCKGGNAPTSNDTGANDTATELDSFAFANEVSHVLSRLRRAMKSNKQSGGKDETNSSLIGVRQFMNRKSEQLVKAFVEKHICLDATIETELLLRQLWTSILEEIAQDSTISSLKKKKKKLTCSYSSQFALGIGILELCEPAGIALDSIADLLSNLACSIVRPNSCDEEKRKRHKTEAIGAIFLLQCHFRCINVEASDDQTSVTTATQFERIGVETSVLLTKILPALQSIVVREQKRTYLTSIAADAFFELIDIFSRVQSSGFHSIASPQLIWKDILPRIEKMITVKRLWMTMNEDATSSKRRATPTLFCKAPYKVILPPILDYMSHRYATTGTDTCSTSISCILCNVMEVNAKEYADDFVHCLIISAQQHENHKLIFENNGERWKSLLLESDEDCAYRNILLAAAKAMVDMPSSTIPLSLFSCLVGMTNDSNLTDSERKILIATISVVRFAIDELKLSQDVEEQAVFKRISPLLILRRLPRAYYQILHKHIVSDTESSRTIMYELATELAHKIRAHALGNDEGSLAKEEKMLLAQAAGHCLPFSVVSELNNESPIALFDLFEKTFSATLEKMRLSESSPGLENIRESKLALFAVCQHIPEASDDDVSGNAFVKVASYVFEFLNESQTTCGDDCVQQELAKLHTGCLHFLGVVFDSLFARKAKKSVKQQIDADENGLLGGLMWTFQFTSSILFNGAIAELEERRFSASTRTSIFNAMVIYSQSCTAEDQRLALFASELLPALMKWVNEAAIDDDVRHPLAASLQLVYTIVAKLGSFDWVALGNESELQIVRLTFRCALKSLCSEGGAGIIRPLRLVSMKVILTVIAVNQNLAKYIEPGEINHAVTAVRDVANRDESQEVRQFAYEICHILSI